jgi:hypothetical protein
MKIDAIATSGQKREFLRDCSNQNRREQIKALVKDVLYNSFAQSLIKIAITPILTLKVFLSIFVLVSSGIASFLVIGSIVSYLSYEVSTTSRTIYENPTLFPKVTFCNVNWFNTEFAYNLTQRNLTYSEISLFSNEEKQKLDHDLNDTLIECKFNNYECELSADFVWSFDPDYGNCYTFNSGSNSSGRHGIDLKETHMAGWNFGLQLTLYANIYEKLLNNTNEVSGLGVLVRLGNSSYLTEYLNSGILITPGMQTNIAVERVFRSILPEPFSNCVIDSSSNTFQTDSDLYTLISQSDYAYTQQLCFSQCLQKYVIDNYNCTLYIFISLYNVSLCDYDLFLHITKNDHIFAANYVNRVCLPMCPLECNQTLYKASISSYQLIGSQYISHIRDNPNLAADFIERPIDSTQVEKSIVCVNIFYESLSYTLNKESPQMNWVSLLGSIGGNLGLFLGVNIFSLCELIEVVIEVFYTTKTSRLRSVP